MGLLFGLYSLYYTGLYSPKQKERRAMKILIRYHADIDKLEQIDAGDWIDLRAAEDVFIPVGSFKLISLGVSIKLPDGYEAHLLPRSSTFIRYGIVMVNSMGIIDNSYCGDNDIWHFPAFSLLPNGQFEGQPASIIHRNDRICQFRLVRSQLKNLDLEIVRELADIDRGGFGSTGRS
jgi:dUTP pyrophosphatase